MIYIDNKTRISVIDDRCVQIEKLKLVTPKGKDEKNPYEKWVWVGYYGTVEQALVGALSKRLFEVAETEQTLETLISYIKNLKEDLLNLKIENPKKMGAD